MAGPAIRAVELAAVLAEAGHPVRLVCPGFDDDPGRGFELVVATDAAALREALRGVDAVVGFSALLADHPWIFELEVPVAVDAYDPGLLETLEHFRGRPFNEQRGWVGAATRHLVEPLRRADIVLVANERQRLYTLGLLTALGRVNSRTSAEDPTLADMCRVVPFGLGATPPVAGDAATDPRASTGIPTDAVVALWGGGLYDWLDPVALVEGVARCRDDRVVAVFLAGPHPTPEVGRQALVDITRERADALGLLGSKVFLHDRWVPYADRGAWLSTSDIGVSLHHRHLETTLSFRTRILDYLWAALPVLCSSGDHFGDLVAQHDLGAVVPPDAPDAVAEALALLAGEAPGPRAARCRRSALVAESMTWPVVAVPLLEWCRSPRLAPDRRAGVEPASLRRRATEAILRLDRSR
jgi:hypothetical protein